MSSRRRTEEALPSMTNMRSVPAARPPSTRSPSMPISEAFAEPAVPLSRVVTAMHAIIGHAADIVDREHMRASREEAISTLYEYGYDEADDHAALFSSLALREEEDDAHHDHVLEDIASKLGVSLDELNSADIAGYDDQRTAGSNMWEGGSQLAKGARKGMWNGLTWLKGKAKGAAQGAKRRVKEYNDKRKQNKEDLARGRAIREEEAEAARASKEGAGEGEEEGEVEEDDDQPPQ